MFQGAKLFLSMETYWLSEAERSISPSASHLFRPLQFVGPGSSFYPLQQVQATGSTGNSFNWAWEIIWYTVLKGRGWQIQQKLPAQAGYCFTQALFPCNWILIQGHNCPHRKWPLLGSTWKVELEQTMAHVGKGWNAVFVVPAFSCTLLHCAQQVIMLQEVCCWSVSTYRMARS
jgi:hypothetical protein